MDHNLVFDQTATQMAKMLSNLLTWVEKAEAFSKSKELDPVDVFLEQRLIVDQYSLVEQIQSTCDAAKFACSRLAGKEPPKHPDTEKTFTEIKARIQSVVTYLKTFKAEDFKGANERKITQTWMKDKYMDGAHYLQAMAVPNFYFHLITAYSIIRANGVDIGKTAFIGGLTWNDL